MYIYIWFRFLEAQLNSMDPVALKRKQPKLACSDAQTCHGHLEAHLVKQGLPFPLK